MIDNDVAMLYHYETKKIGKFNIDLIKNAK